MSTTCAACGSANESSRKFCGECGHGLAISCRACASPNPAGAKFLR
ncbi:MAG: zinc ribbon domain-containing protein [Actinobacteria bacterium]|nr:zinc ribbon domain-containing protein [Actinomycetota bacterium]